MASEPKQTVEERLAQLERERALIVAALKECQQAVEKGRDATFAVGRFVGAVGVVLADGHPNSKTAVAFTPATSQHHLLTKEQLCKALNLPSVWAVDRLRKQKKIPSIKTGHRTVLYDLGKVAAALGRLETEAARYL